MRRMRFVIFTVLLGFCGTAEVAGADDAADAWKALRAGGHVALMRHADAPGGVGDPPGFRVEDCATQRNLSEKGRADAEKIGSRLKREGIAFEKILSSPWCRCIDTARLLNLGTVETEATFGNVVVLKDQRETLDRRRPRAHRPMDGARKPACRDPRCEHSGADRRLAGQRRDRRRQRRKRSRRTCRSPAPRLNRTRLYYRASALASFVAIPVPVGDHGLISDRLRGSLDGRAFALRPMGLRIRKDDKESEQADDHHPVDQEGRSQPVSRFSLVFAM